MNNCIYCGETGAVTVTSDYVCTGVKCRANYMMNPHNNAVTKSYRENAMEFQLMVKVSFAALFSKRRDWIFNPFPWCFKTSDHFSTDILGQAAPPNRDYKYLEDCTKIIDIDDLFTLISEVSTDQDLINKLNECNPIGIGLYQFLKFIIETKNIETEYREWTIDNNKKYQQFKIKHDTTVESNFMNLSSQHCYLFHGSNIANWHSIIRNGIFNASGTKLMTAGAVYGNGVYLSDNLNINSSYSCGSLDNYRETSYNDVMVVAVFQVSGEKSQYKKAENIYVVNDSSKLLLRYLIVLNRSADLATISKLLEAQYMKNHNLEAKQKELVNHRMQVRINTDMNKIKKMSKFVDIEQDSNTYFIHFDIGYMVTFAVHFTDNYPFEPPLIFIRNPIVNSQMITHTGVVTAPELLLSKWRPTQALIPIIENTLSMINFKSEGQYDITKSFVDALIIRK